MASAGRPPKGQAQAVPGVVSNPKSVGTHETISNVVSYSKEVENVPIDPGHTVTEVKKHGE